MPAFVKAPLGVSIALQDQGPAQPFGVRLDWRAPASTESTGTPEIKEGWMICWFLPRKSAEDAWQMTQLDSSEFGVMRRYDIQQLYKILRLMQYQPQTFDPEADTLKGRALYVLQQTINAINLGCVYALIAIGFHPGLRHHAGDQFRLRRPLHARRLYRLHRLDPVRVLFRIGRHRRGAAGRCRRLRDHGRRRLGDGQARLPADARTCRRRRH